jgi:transposase
MLVLLLGITPPGINNSVEYAAYREADTALWYDSGNSQKSGRFQPERVAALNRITRQVYSGMGGSFAPDFPELLAFIIQNKFVDHLPYYRQEKRFERLGARISRQDMSNWQQKAYIALKPLKDLLKEQLLSGPVIQMDETTVQVMNEPEKSNTSTSYMWLARGGPPGKPVVDYAYHRSRGSEYAKAYLSDFSGYLQTDGYVGYETALKDRSDIIHVGCMAHVRRKFFEAGKSSKKAGSAHQAVSKIAEFYRIEKELRSQDLSDDEFTQKRKARIAPVADRFKAWLDKKALSVRPSSAVGRAVTYALSQWDKVMKYIESPYLTPDNNGAENAIRPFVLGRKNWLFSGSPEGAEGSCFMFSLIETARQNGLNPYGYLVHVFTKAPEIGNPEKIPLSGITKRRQYWRQ